MTPQSKSKTNGTPRKRETLARNVEASGNSKSMRSSNRVVPKTKVATRLDRKPKTKKSRLISMLQSKSGATIEAISIDLGWQHHTTRAAMTGLRQAGFIVERTKPKTGGAGCFRIVETVTASSKASPK